jgi:hypothetical protein
MSLASSTESEITLERLRQMDAVVEQFKLENQRLPSESEGLQAVRNYLHSDSALLDAWGRPFFYGLSSTNDGRVIYSTGRDGVSATGGNDPDDINLWDSDQKWRKQYQSQPIQPNTIIGGLVLSLLTLILVAARRRWKLSQKAG